MTRTHRGAALTVLVLLVAGTTAGCSSAASSSAMSTPSATAQPNTSAVPADTVAMCDEFTQIASGATGSDPTTKEGWDLKIKSTTRFVDAAPAEWQSAAQTYLGIVNDRATLLAGYGYPLITDLPSDVRSAFIADHTTAQNVANTFIAFAKESCGVS